MAMAKRILVTLACALAAGAAYGDTLETNEFQITVSSANETTPTLGNDGTSDLVVYTMRVILPDRTLAPGDIWYQRVAGGAPIGPAVQVTADPTDDELNDVSGDYIVYTAYESTSSMRGTIMVYRISTYERWPVAQVEVAREARIHGNDVVWVQGPSTATQVMWYELGWLGTPREARIVAGPVPPASEVAIGSGYIVWTQRSGGQADVWGFDLLNASRVQITMTAGIDESQPATSGPWITWQTQRQGASSVSIEAMNPSAWDVRSVVLNDSFNLRPSIDGDLIAWESDVVGNYDIFVYRLSTAESFQVTTDPSDSLLNDVFGSRIAYVDPRNGSQDVYVSDLTFIAPNQPPIASAGADVSVYANEDVALAGTATDLDLDPIVGWQWAVIAQPAGSNPYLSDPARPDPVFRGDVPGDYELSLVVHDGAAWSAADTMVVHVVPVLPPVAVASATPVAGMAPLTVQLDASQSNDPQGGTLTYVWSFGDGSPDSTEIAPLHVFQLPGTYVVGLMVVDSRGQWDSDLVEIEVAAPNSPPTAAPTATPSSGAAPLAVAFAADASDVDGDPLTYAWDFGDPMSPDNTSALASPLHVYAQPGTYVAWLTVSDGVDWVSASLTVVVSPAVELNVTRAEIKFRNKRSLLADVQIKAELYASIPGADDVIALYLDGVQVFAAPFGSFSPVGWDDEQDVQEGDPYVYKLRAKHLRVRIDFLAGRLAVDADKVVLTGFDPRNGVDVEVMLGDAVAVDRVVPTIKGERHYWHYRPERGRGHCSR
jgi:PKD repeat protein